MRGLIFQHPSFDKSVESHTLVDSRDFAPSTLPSRNSWFGVFMCCSHVYHWVRTKVRRILLRASLQQFDVVIRHAFLYPEIPSLNMA